jgi:inner membrane protein
MASLFLHAALPVVARGAFAPLPRLERRLVIVAAVCACLPDLDVLSYVFEVRASEPLGHRGLSHSIFVAVAVALVAAIAFFRSLGIGSPAWRRAFAFLLGATVSHGVIDAATKADVGVALLAPFASDRYTSPLVLIPSTQLGLNEYFGWWGLLTVTNEALYVLAPIALVVAFASAVAPANRDRARARRVTVDALAWLVLLLVARLGYPEYFRATMPRVLRASGSHDAGEPGDITHDDLPAGRLVTRFEEAQSLGLFEKELLPSHALWSSSFFPSWFGGEGGRWTEGNARLGWRTLFGFPVPTEAEAQQWLAAASAGDDAARRRLFALAPTEKADIALGHLRFPATTQALSRSHNGKPRYWSGRCNGVAAAALVEAEPFRVVEVIGVDGSRVSFHPNDIKALLAVAYYDTRSITVVGGTCEKIAFDPAETCSMEPTVLVMAIVNRIGLARDSFYIDALPSIAKQYYSVARARVHVVRGPRPPLGEPSEPALAGRIASLVDVEIAMTLSSTTLTHAVANVPDPGAADGSRYARVGLVPVEVRYQATIALDATSEMIGGRWTGDPAEGPDNVIIVSGGPKVLDNGMLAAASALPWSFVRELARASADDGPLRPTLDLRTRCDDRCP